MEPYSHRGQLASGTGRMVPRRCSSSRQSDRRDGPLERRPPRTGASAATRASRRREHAHQESMRIRRRGAKGRRARQVRARAAPPGASARLSRCPRRPSRAESPRRLHAATGRVLGSSFQLGAPPHPESLGVGRASLSACMPPQLRRLVITPAREQLSARGRRS